MYGTQLLAHYVSSYPTANMPSEIRERACCCILDAIASAAAGFSLPNVHAVHQVARHMSSGGKAALWFSGESLGSTAAAFCNAAAVSALDFDDGHRGARGHPGAAIVPAVFAVASEMDISAEEVLTAVALGYEVALRVARAQNIEVIKSRQSGRWTGYGVVSAAGRLRKSDPEKLAQALSVVGVLSPNQEANGSSGYAQLTGNDVKEGIPWSVVTGLTALLLAEADFTGPLDLLDHASHFDRMVYLADLDHPAEITKVYFKPYSCCRYIHAALDALREITGRFDLAPHSIISIEVQTFAWALRLANRIVPQSLTDIQYSLPYCLAIAIHDGPTALAPIGSSLLGRADLAEMAGKVHLSVDPEIESRFPAETPARLRVRLSDGSIKHSSIITPRGDRSNPLGWSDLCEKFYTASRSRMTAHQQHRLVASAEALKSGDAAPLFACLRERLIK